MKRCFQFWDRPISDRTWTFPMNLSISFRISRDIPKFGQCHLFCWCILGQKTISSRFLHQWSCNNLYRWVFSPCLIGDENSQHETPRSKAETILKVNAWLSDVMLCKPRISWHVFKERVTSWRQRLENYLGRATLFGFLLAPANRPNSIWTHIRLEVWSVL